MKRKSYVPTTLGQYLNENKSITLTRKYGEKQPVVVGSRAPMRNAVLSYVAENAKVSRVSLKRFIAGLNETSKNPAAAANMWLKRNQRFFESTTAGGVTSYKLSKLGAKLVNVIQPQTTGALSEETKIKPRTKINEKDHDFKDEKTGEKGITDEDDEVDEKCNEETREERVKRIVEQIKAKRAAALNEEDEADEEKDEEADEKAEEDAEKADDDAEEAAEDDEGAEDVIDDEPAEAEEGEEEGGEVDDDRVEITEFIITVDDVNDAIAELGELGVEAETVTDELGGDEFEAPVEDELGGDLDLGDEAPEEGGDELADFDLDLGGELEGEEEAVEEVPEVEESITGGEGFERKVATQNKKTPPNLVEDDDEFEMGDLDSFDPEADVTGEEESIEELPVDTPEDGGEELDLGDEAGEDLDLGDEAPAAGTQIKVSAENWDVLKGWLEGKGVDIEDMFGGEIEVEGEEGIEDEISFDGLEDAEIEDESPEHEAAESDEEEAEEKAEGDDDEEDEEVEESAKKDEKKGGFQPGKKGVNPFPQK